VKCDECMLPSQMAIERTAGGRAGVSNEGLPPVLAVLRRASQVAESQTPNNACSYMM
jgi:hypothetical protein